jgi:MinD-like ATPase involved in chromosome partitioning or flagellar assembly
LLRLPPTWIVRSATSSVATSLLDWTLILSSPEPRDLMDSYALAKRVFALRPRARIGVAIHGVRDAKEAARAFGRLADVVERRLERQLVSYGSLIDDLQIYRAIVAKRPIGLAYPQSAAAKALADLATRLLRDAPAAAHG